MALHEQPGKRAMKKSILLFNILLVLFAFSTVIAWAYYGEKCFEYLFGEKFVILYRICFTLIIIPGAVIKLNVAWAFADIANGIMIIPNLIAIIALSGIILSETDHFLKMIRMEQATPE